MKVFSYWSGPLSWMERLSIASAKASGHQLTIFSYAPDKLRQEGLDAEIADAREVFADPALDNMDAKLPDHFSDHFRVEGLAKEQGVWVDLDIFFVKTLPDQDYLFSWQEPGCVCGAVLGLPAGSPMLRDYLEICRKRPVSVAAPWLPWFRRKQIELKHVRRKLSGRRGVDMPYGPPAVTYLIEKHGLVDKVLPPAAFFPVHWSEIMGLMQTNDYVPAPETYSVHLWRNVCGKLHNNPLPDPDSWMDRKCRDFDIALPAR